MSSNDPLLDGELESARLTLECDVGATPPVPGVTASALLPGFGFQRLGGHQSAVPEALSVALSDAQAAAAGQPIERWLDPEQNLHLRLESGGWRFDQGSSWHNLDYWEVVVAYRLEDR